MHARIATLAAALIGLPAVAAWATEYTRFEALWVDPASPPVGVAAEPDGAPGCRRFGLLSLPPAWQIDDAAGVVLSLAGDPIAGAAAAPLAAALLGHGAAVLEIASGAPCRDEVAPAAPPAAPLADLFGGLRALHEDAGAGLVLAIGVGAAGPVALEAARRSGLAAGEAEGPLFAAGLALGERPAMRPGAEPLPRERWAERGPMLCGLLRQAEAMAGEAPPTARIPSAEACMAALFPPRRAPPEARPPAVDAGMPRRASIRSGAP